MERDECHLVFNGEIYNYLELRGELEALGRIFTTTSDTEVLLQAYLELDHAAWKSLKGCGHLPSGTRESRFFSSHEIGLGKNLFILPKDRKVYILRRNLEF